MFIHLLENILCQNINYKKNCGDNIKIYMNPFTGQKATTKRGMKRWDYPPWLKGDWVESNIKWKAIKHNYVVMRKKKR